MAGNRRKFGKDKLFTKIDHTATSGVVGDAEYQVHGENALRVATTFTSSGTLTIQGRIENSDTWDALGTLTSGGDTDEIDVGSYDYVRFNFTVAAGSSGEIAASGFFKGSSASGGGATNSFSTIQTDTGTSPVADSSTDTLTFTSSDDNIEIDGNSTTDTVDINVKEGPLPVTSTAPAASALGASQVQYYVNEAANTLNFKLKYAGGAVKRGKIPLYDAPDWTTTKQYALDNTNDFFNAEVTASQLGLSGSTAFSISMLVNFDMVANDEFYWFSFFAGTTTGKLEVYRLNSSIRFQIDGAYTDITPTRIDGLYHLVFVYDGSLGSDILRAKIYHNGSDATTTGSGTIPASVNTDIADEKLGIMNRYSATPNYYDGKIRELSIWNKALSSAEVTTLYNSGSYSDPTAISGCQASWWFGDNTSDNVSQVVDNVGDNNLVGQGLDDGVIVSV